MQETPQSIAPIALALSASLIAVGAVEAIVCQPPKGPVLTWPQLWLAAVVFVLVAVCAHALAVWIVRTLFREYLPTQTNLLLYSLWLPIAFVPLAAITIHAASVVAAFVFPVIAACAAMLLKRWTIPPNLTDPTNPANPPHEIFQLDDSPPLARVLLPVVLAALALEGGIAALGLQRFLLTGLAFALSAALIVWRAPSQKAGTNPALAKKTFLRQTAMALLLTAIALTPFLRKPGVAGELAGLFRMAQVRPVSAARRVEDRSSAYSGVILFVPVKPKEKLLPPAPAESMQPGSAVAKPVVIPFDGVYWYFRQPDTRPLPDARIVHADPAKVNIHSTDLRPLQMEAHQRLAEPLKISCCSAMKMHLLNADTRPGAIAVEILLRDSAKKTTASLGTEMLPSSTVIPMPLNRAPVPETLRFSMRNQERIQQFDEITVVIKPARERSLAGAKLAIESFTLEP